MLRKIQISLENAWSIKRIGKIEMVSILIKFFQESEKIKTDIDKSP
jgi:hypothetical protein